MKKFLLLTMCLLLSGCLGNSSENADLTGQAKKVTHVTPVICDNYVAFDVSLGVMKNGTGSMSTQDMWLTVQSDVDLKLLQKAVETSAIVHIHYDTPRWPICTEEHILTAIEIVP